MYITDGMILRSFFFVLHKDRVNKLQFEMGDLMDTLDIHLLKLLQEDGRITVSELSKILRLSRPSVSERLIRLKDQGVIVGFSARIPPAGVGRGMLLFIQISQLRVHHLEFEKHVQNQPLILECHRVTGTVSYMIKAAVSGMGSLQKLVDQLTPFGTINSSIVLSSPVAFRPLLPEETEA